MRKTCICSNSPHLCVLHECSMGLKVPAVVAEAKAALDAGHCVVIGLQSTGEVSVCVCVCLCVC